MWKCIVNAHKPLNVDYSPDLQDLERLQILVKMTANNMALSVADNGHRFAISVSSSPLTPSSVLGELLSGIQQVLCSML